MPLVPQVSQGQAVPTDERHILEQDRRKKKVRCQNTKLMLRSNNWKTKR